jgi:hypothetical protein
MSGWECLSEVYEGSAAGVVQAPDGIREDYADSRDQRNGGIVLTAPIPRLAETLSRPPRLLLPNGSDDRNVHDGVFLLDEHYVSGED